MAVIALFLNSCDHIDAVGDKVNELKDLRTESTQGINGMKLDQIIEGVRGDATVQEVNQLEFDHFTKEPGKLNIVEFRSGGLSSVVGIRTDFRDRGHGQFFCGKAWKNRRGGRNRSREDPTNNEGPGSSILSGWRVTSQIFRNRKFGKHGQAYQGIHRLPSPC